MTASLFTDLQATAGNLVDEATLQGLAPMKPVRIKLLGSSVQGPLSADTRMVIISFEQPTVPANGCVLWCDANKRLIYKSDPVAQKWNIIQQRLDMFTDYTVGVPG